jgi:hypothetical protein
MSYLKDLQRDLKRPQKMAGFSSDKSNLDAYSRRARENSHTATRAKAGKHGSTDLPSTGGPMKLHSTSRKSGNTGDPYPEARANMNHAGSSSYMRGVRRDGR